MTQKQTAASHKHYSWTYSNERHRRHLHYKRFLSNISAIIHGLHSTVRSQLSHYSGNGVVTSPDLPMYPSGQSTWAPCDTLSSQGSNLSPDASAYQRIISNNFYTHDEHRDNIGQEKGFNGVIYKLRPLLTTWLAASRCWRGWSK